MTGEGMERRGHLERVTQHVKEALHNPHDHNPHDHSVPQCAAFRNAPYGTGREWGVYLGV